MTNPLPSILSVEMFTSPSDPIAHARVHGGAHGAITLVDGTVFEFKNGSGSLNGHVLFDFDGVWMTCPELEDMYRDWRADDWMFEDDNDGYDFAQAEPWPDAEGDLLTVEDCLADDQCWIDHGHTDCVSLYLDQYGQRYVAWDLVAGMIAGCGWPLTVISYMNEDNHDAYPHGWDGV